MLAALAAWYAPGAAGAQPVFVDVTGAAGLSYLQHQAVSPPSCFLGGGVFCQPERMTGGAAVADVDLDGLPDLFVSRLDAPDLLFRNLGDGSFEEFSAQAGLASFPLQSNGAGFADVDNDGDPDLVVTVIGEAGDSQNDRNFLFLNDGAGTFSEAAAARGLADESAGERKLYGVSFGDYDRNGWVDIHVNEWLPGGFSRSRLFQNAGPVAPGHFSDATSFAGVSLGGVHAFASAFSDLDGDGWPDLAVAADFGTSRLFWNDGDGTFSDGTAAAGVGTDENGMGSTFGDYDGDGDLDWFVTSIRDPDESCESAPCNWGYTGNRLYRYDGGRSFGDATDAAGVRDGYWGWGAVFFDYDNDGDLDLAMTNGVDFPNSSFEDPFATDPMRLWENGGGGGMTEVSAVRGLTDTGSGKGLLVVDYDADGDLDLFVVNNAGAPRLYRNDGGNANGWLRVRVRGTDSNRDGLGAQLRVRAQPGGPLQVREMGAASHFLGQSEPVAHFGLGPGTAPVHSVEVFWPRSGRTNVYANVPRGTSLVVVEPVAGVPGLGGPGRLVLALMLLGLGAALSCGPRLGRRGVAPASGAR